MRLRKIVAPLLLLFSACPLAAQENPVPDTKPEAPPPMLTAWAKDVKTEAPLPEYPRPTLTRPDWLSLNGPWQFEEARSGAGLPRDKKLAHQIIVPFPPQAPLSGIGKNTNRVWYRRLMQIPAAWQGKRVLLHMGAVNYESGFYLNGKLIGTHKGGYDSFSFDITAQLIQGDNELIIGAINPADGGSQPRGRQNNWPNNNSLTTSTGIWQSIWLEAVPQSYIRDLVIVPDVDGAALAVKADTVNAEGDTLHIEVFDGARKVGEAKGVANLELRVPMPGAKLWSPETPFLYDLKVALLREGQPVDAVGSYAAMRKISLGRDAAGKARIFLNNQPYFGIGVLDQGYWPDGVYTAPTDEALRFDIETAKKLGFNTIRKHQKIEPERWYYWADKLGVLVWQDMPQGRNDSPQSKKQFEEELIRLVEGRRHHPSIVMWVLFHEGWGQFDTERLTPLVKVLDGTRLVSNASGGNDRAAGDIHDTHAFPFAKANAPETNRATVAGEFGNVFFLTPGHLWTEKIEPKENTQILTETPLLTRTYENALTQALKLKDAPGASAVIYRQLTDVEQELTGLLTYDRAAFKIEAARIAQANKGQAQIAALEMLSPTAQAEPVEWRYTFTRPEDGWEKPEFDDSQWSVGAAGFGKDMKDKKEATVRTEWKSGGIWLRREFEIKGEIKTPVLSVFHDDDFTVYINGVPAAKAKDQRSDYAEFALSPAARATLKPGKNIIAVFCKQNWGSQFIDVGLGQF